MQHRVNSAAALAPSAQTPSEEIRRETEDDEEYLVAPVVMIQEGVYQYPTTNGQVSHEYLSDEEIADSVDEWERRPITLGHPVDEKGRPTVMDRAAKPPVVVGETRSPVTANDGEKLTGEAWFSLSDLDVGDGDFEAIVDALEAGDLVETSTGYTSHTYPAAGRFNGDQYTGSQEIEQPDHLAVFPPTSDQKGNCPVANGCGVGRLNQDDDPTEGQTVQAPGENFTLADDAAEGFVQGFQRLLRETFLGQPPDGRANEAPDGASGDADDGEQTPSDEPAESGSDADADADTEVSTPSMKDAEKIDKLVEEHGLDRENIEPLEGEDCLDQIYERFESTDTETETESEEGEAGDGGEDETPSADQTPDSPDGGETGEVTANLEQRLNALEEQTDRIDELEEENERLRKQVSGEADLDAALVEETDLSEEDVATMSSDAKKAFAETAGVASEAEEPTPSTPQQGAVRANYAGVSTDSRTNSASEGEDVSAAGFDNWSGGEDE